MLDISNKVSYAYLGSNAPTPQRASSKRRIDGPAGGAEIGGMIGMVQGHSRPVESGSRKMEVTMWEFLAECLVSLLAVILFWRMAWRGK